MLWNLLFIFCYCVCTAASPIRYRWMQNDTWSPCSVECGQGTSDAIFKCYDTVLSRLVVESMCQEKRPSIEKECFEKPCLNSVGYVDQYDTDTTSRRHGDIQDVNNTQEYPVEDATYRMYDHLRNVFNEKSEDIQVKNNRQYDWVGYTNYRKYDGAENYNNRQYDGVGYTNYRQYSSPDIKNEEKDRQYPGHWFIGDWGECSATCGRGTISRDFACVNRDSTAVLKDSECPGEKPQPYKVCNLKKCPVKYTWHVGRWGKCSKECDSTRKRKVHCKSIEGKKVHDMFCKDAGKKTRSVQDCGIPCVRWVVGKWRECKYGKERERSCREAVQTRCVICIHKTTYELSRKCDPKEKPKRKRSCSQDACAKQV